MTNSGISSISPYIKCWARHHERTPPSHRSRTGVPRPLFLLLAALAAVAFVLLSPTPTNAQNADDCAGDRTTTCSIAVGSSVTGEIESASDVDYFSISVTSGAIYQFDLEGSPTSKGTLADPHLNLWGSTGATSLTSDNNSGTGNNARITWTATGTGTFYVATSSSNPGATGTYTLTAAVAPVTLISNVGQGADSENTGSIDYAQNFTTGSNSGGYTLTSVEIVSEDPEGDDASVSLCTVDASGFPTSDCTALTAPGSFAAGTLAFTAPGNTTLDANTTYTLLITSPGGETLTWDATTSDSEDTGGATGWSIANAYHFKSPGWRTTSSGKSFRITVKGTVKADVPGAPTSLTATAGDAQVALSWAAPASDGGAAVTKYRHRHKLSSASTWGSWTEVTGTAATVTGLTNGSAYDFEVQANNSSGWGASASASATPAVGLGVHISLNSAQTSPIGMWSPDGETLWVGQWTSRQIYAFDLSDGSEDTSEGWTLTNPGAGSDNNIKPTGIYSDGTHVWVSDADHDRVFRYDFSSKSHNSVNLALHSDNGKRQGLWSNGTTAWIADSDDNKLYAYTLSDFSRDSGKDIDLHSDNGEVRGIWSDGTIIWALDRDDEVIYAYTLSDGSRDADLDIDLPSEGVNYNSIWSDGTIMYVIENAAGSTRSPHIHRLRMPRTVVLDPVLLSNTGQARDGLDDISTYTWAAQQFTTGSNAAGYTLSSVSVSPTFTGTPSVTMSLRADDGSDNPSSTDLATFAPPTTWSSGNANVFTLSTPVELQANTKYWVRMTASTSFEVPYADGSNLDSGSQAGWDVERSCDPDACYTDAIYQMILRGTVAVPADVLLSNTAQTSLTDGTQFDGFTWLARQFTTGPDSGGYMLGSIRLLGGGSQNTVPISVSLRADNGSNRPSSTDLATFNPPSSWVDGENLFTRSSAVTLQANTKYWVYIDTSSAIGADVAVLKRTLSDQFVGKSGWSFGGACFKETGNVPVSCELGDPATYWQMVLSSTVVTTVAPGAPTSLTATAGDAQVDLAWAAPDSDGGAAVTMYRHRHKLTSATTWGSWTEVSATTLTATVTGLTNDSAYDFEVQAQNSVGWGASASASAAPVSLDPVLLSNDGQTPGTDSPSDLTLYAWAAQQFTTGSNSTGYTLSSVSVRAGVTGTPTVTMSLRADDGSDNPSSTDLATFTAPSFWVSGSANVFTLSTPFELEASTKYWLYMTATGGSFEVDFADSLNADSSSLAGWSIGRACDADFCYDSSPFQVILRGTVVPTTVLISNVGQGGDDERTSRNRSAQRFTTGSNSAGYTLTSVEVISEDTAGDRFSVSVCTVTGSGFPTSTCTALTAPGSFSAGTLAFTAPDNTTLDAGTTYTIVIAPAGNAFVSLDTTTANGEDAGGAAGWSIRNSLDFNNGANWAVSANESLRITVKGTVRPVVVPGAPTSLTATAGVKQIALSWTAPASDGGAAITGYTLQVSDSDPSGTANWADVSPQPQGTATTYTHTGLADGAERWYRVAATNSVGDGAYSATATATTHNVPGAPTNFTATAGNARVDLAWDPPASDGGAPVTMYRLRHKLSSASSWGSWTELTGTTATVPGLTNGSAYDFEVQAQNSVGWGASASASATPAPPDPNPVLLSNDGQTTFSHQLLNDVGWLAAQFTTGSNSDGYTLSSVALIGDNAQQTVPLTVTLRARSGVRPSSTVLATFTNPSSWVAGENFFTLSSPVKLEPDTSYWVYADTSGASNSDLAGVAFILNNAADGRSLPGWSFGYSCTNDTCLSSNAYRFQVVLRGTVTNPALIDTTGNLRSTMYRLGHGLHEVEFVEGRYYRVHVEGRGSDPVREPLIAVLDSERRELANNRYNRGPTTHGPDWDYSGDGLGAKQDRFWYWLLPSEQRTPDTPDYWNPYYDESLGAKGLAGAWREDIDDVPECPSGTMCTKERTPEHFHQDDISYLNPFTFKAPASGTYFVQLRSYTYDGNQYRLTVTQVDTSADDEPAESTATAATAAADGSYHQFRLEFPFDRDWVKLENLTVGNSYQVQVKGSIVYGCQNCRTVAHLMSIRDADGDLVDSTGAYPSRQTFTATSTTHFVVAGSRAGSRGMWSSRDTRWYVKVTDQSGAGGQSDGQPRSDGSGGGVSAKNAAPTSKSVVPTAPAPVVDDYGDSPDTAQPLADGDVLDGVIETSGDKDWFRAELTEGRRWRVRVIPADRDGEYEVNLYGVYDANGNVLVSWSPRWFVVDLHPPADGVHYFAVGSDNPQAVGAYTIKLKDMGPSDREPRPQPETGLPTISGTAQVGETLTADTSGIADEDGLDNVSYSYQWAADGEDIAGATDSTYTLADADEGKAISVTVSFTDDAGNEESVTSAATAAVEARPNTPATGLPTISGTAQVGETLTADASGIADEDGLTIAAFGYQWAADGADISGATDSTYTLVDADAGTAISVTVSFTDDAGNEESLTSAATAAVEAAIGQLPELPAGSTILWSADMTVVDYGAGSVGAGSADLFANQVSADNHEAQWLWSYTPGRQVDLSLLTAIMDTEDLVLHIGDLELPFADASGSFSNFTWYGVDVDWGDGQTLPARIARVAQVSEPVANTPATGLPTINGTAQVGETLTADTSAITDEDGLDNATFSYQWQADGSDIANATDSTYTPVDADEGAAISVTVSFTDDAGNEESLTSTATAVVEAKPNTPATGLPTIGGTAQVGETLTADTSSISDEDGLSNATFSYQWAADGADIAGATGSTYTLADADEGTAISVEVSFTDDAGNDESLTSAATAAVEAKPNTPATGAPTMSGIAQVGETLTADTSAITDEDGLTNVSYSYQWAADGADISEATDSTYTLTDTDEGTTVTVTVSFTDDAGNEESLTSTATVAVAGVPATPLTATVSNVPASHDGENVFTFELRFSEEFPISYRTLRDYAFIVSGGDVTRAKRIEKGSNIAWRIHVRPDSNGAVTIILPVTTDCDAPGAICTDDGRMLSTRLELTIDGPS